MVIVAIENIFTIVNYTTSFYKTIAKYLFWIYTIQVRQIANTVK